LLDAITRLLAAFEVDAPELPDVRGALRVEGRARGPLRGPSVEGRVTSERIDGLGLGLTALDLQVELAGAAGRPRGCAGASKAWDLRVT
jgi:autotransporter translocation and assembly factor TamB